MSAARRVQLRAAHDRRLRGSRERASAGVRGRACVDRRLPDPYGVGAHFAFLDTLSFAAGQRIVDPTAFTGATIFGLALFAILFLGPVLSVFLTLGVVRGDAEVGLLQPLIVRPIGRTTMLVARFAGAAGMSAGYVLVVYLAALLITGAVGGWWPDHVAGPALGLATAAVVITGLSAPCAVFLSATAQGIAVLMIYGAGITAGLLGQIGHALNSHTLKSIAQVATWAVPFEALYQSPSTPRPDTTGSRGAALGSGPSVARRWGRGVVVWSAAYVALALALAVAAFSRRDL